MHVKQSVLLIVAAVMMVSGCSRSPQAKEAKYLEKGKKEYQKKNYAAAVLHFKNAVQVQPRDAEPYYQLGLAYWAMNDFTSAASCFRKTLELSPKHAGAQLKVAELMATSRTKEILQEAQKRSQNVLGLLPGDPDA